ncbi:MAG: BlaI/MecI/CopY family transcriptional regulator [Prolixibacteraceae bacterium]|jgi:predicted transcriptional regulator|nr:BlaI/MecI/CopY family transcriptional regulator [Prolixibacteraceae bacterium]
MKELTRAEEQLMQILWKIKKGFIKDLIDKVPEPKPAYNTVSTFIRIMEKKGFVGHTAYGKTHEYYPLISKKEYTKLFMKGLLKNYFSNSFQEMVSFFAKEDKMSINELEKLLQEVKKDLEREKK